MGGISFLGEGMSHSAVVLLTGFRNTPPQRPKGRKTTEAEIVSSLRNSWVQGKEPAA